MSFDLDLNLGEAFAQIKGKGLSHTWYQPRRSLVDGLKDALGARISDGGVLRVTTSRTSTLAETPPTAAAIVTAGFETLAPALTSESTFAVRARLNADGSERSSIESELATLLSKLELLKASAVAICFLHSAQFPTHEKQVTSFLIERGYTVFASHEEDGNELTRFAAAMKKAALFSWLSEMAMSLQTDLAALGEWTVTANSSGETVAASATLHLGFERFTFARAGGKQRALRIQPSQRIVVGPMNAPTFETELTAFGSGPMFLGRSFQPTTLDLFFAMDHFEDIEALKTAQGPRQKSRILEMFLTLAKDIESEYRIDTLSVAKDLQSLALELITAECLTLAGGKSINVTGGLASALTPLLAKHRRGLDFKISPEAVL